MRTTITSGLALLLTVTAIAATSSPAMGFSYEKHYCYNYLPPNGTCPPYGSSTWIHIELNEGNDPRENEKWTCIDEYLDPSGSPWYTSSKCVYYINEEAKDFPGGTWGYPRSWNGGANEHYVEATEYGW